MTRVFEGVVFWCGREMERKVSVLEIVFELDTMLLLLVAADAEIKARAAGHGRYGADRETPRERKKCKTAGWRTNESSNLEAINNRIAPRRRAVTARHAPLRHVCTCHFRRCGKFEANCHTSCTTTSSLELFSSPMEDTPHKAHRPAQSGAKADKKGKAKEKQHGFNEKVFRFYWLSGRVLIFVCIVGFCPEVG